MERFFRKLQLKILTSFLGCITLPTVVKCCKSEGIYNKITTHSYFFGLSKGGKMM